MALARVEVPIIVQNPSGAPVSGASVAISYRSNGVAAPWWTSETGGTSSTSPVTTDSNGRISAWVERGAYNCTISGTGITTYVESYDAAPGGNQTIDQDWLSSLVLPSGIVLPYGGLASPNTNVWLMAQGGTASRTGITANLFSVYGTRFGAGDGSTTFGLPDLRGRVPVGAGTGAGLSARAVADIFGTELEVLTAAQVPHLVVGSAAVPGTSPTINVLAPTGVGGAVDLNPSGGGSHNNFQPSLVLNYLIKV